MKLECRSIVYLKDVIPCAPPPIQSALLYTCLPLLFSQLQIIRTTCPCLHQDQSLSDFSIGCGLDRGAEVPTSVKILLCPESHTAASDCNGGLLLEKPRFILDCRTKKKVRWDQVPFGILSSYVMQKTLHVLLHDL